MINEELRRVIDGGYCVGCGACATVPNSPMVMTMNQYGQFVAVDRDRVDFFNVTSPVNLDIVCPFSNKAPDENTIAQALFGSTMSYNEYIGYYRDIYAGYVIEDDYRKNGSS
ncbi:MAG TPA: coenzyme F420 hydrogenase, partial [Anaerolineae bacterium]|nr:coenzyme F420 hydrogenase [Anaerolineae bacterium]HQI85726.1 coenzyme F420 hydrogenase [Anaerolineae bacterium]